MKKYFLLKLLALCTSWTLMTFNILEAQPMKTIMKGEEAIATLKAGNERFVTDQTQVFTATDDDKERLSATTQKPHSVIFTCSDARLALELIFDQHFGELFIARSAGNVLGDSIIGSIEFAIKELKAVNVVILGHSNCGAVTKALESPLMVKTGSPYVDYIMHNIQERLMEKNSREFSKNFVDECTKNVKGIRNALIRKSNLIREAYEQNKITVVYALYHMDTGRVEFFED